MSECPSLSPCQLNLDLVSRKGQKLASTLSPLSVQQRWHGASLYLF